MKTNPKNYLAWLVARLGLTAMAILAASDCAMAERPLNNLKTVSTPPGPFPAPKILTVEGTKDGVMLQWGWLEKVEPIAWLVLRGTDSPPADPALAVVSFPCSGQFLDRGFHGKATYQVVALAPDGRRGASQIVSFQPPLTLAPGGLSALSATKLGRASASSAAPPAASGPLTPTPAIYLFRPESNPYYDQSLSGNYLAHAGDTVVVYGAGLDGLTSATLQYAKEITPGVWVPNTNALKSFPLVVRSSGPTGFKFTVPEGVADGLSSITAPAVVTITKGPTSVISRDHFVVCPKPVERKILSVEQTNVLAGGRVRIHGQGFNDCPGGYPGVIGGYFGTGVPGSLSNPLISAANRRDDYVELWLPAGFAQQGILMLTGGGAADYTSANPPIVVTCFKGLPQGYVVGAVPNQYGYPELVARPGSYIEIRGNNLSAVSRVLDGSGNALPFTYGTIGVGPTTVEELGVTLPNTTTAYYTLMLENKVDPSSKFSSQVYGEVVVR